VTFIILTATL